MKIFANILLRRIKFLTMDSFFIGKEQLSAKMLGILDKFPFSAGVEKRMLQRFGDTHFLSGNHVIVDTLGEEKKKPSS